MSATHPSQQIDPADLPRLAAEVAARAQAAGVLEPIPTRVAIVEQGGVRFQVRVLDTLWRKERALARQQAGETPADPFGPCDPRLLLGDLGPAHCCVLNKYPALGRHLLVVTRRWEPQESLLTAADFGAAWACLGALDGFVFYNGGQVAGASQGHKHLQIVPLPLEAGEPGLPLGPTVENACACFAGVKARALPFVHAIARFPAGLWRDPGAAAVHSAAAYRHLLAGVGLPCGPGCTRQPGPYNLLMTRAWMMVVPRAEERWGRASVNALGFAGCLLARDEAELEQMRAAGLLAILGSVGRGV